MKIKEAIDLVDELKPNHYPFTMKVKWLSKLDGQIFTEVFLTHEGCKLQSFVGYDDAPPEQELLVPFPFAEDIYNYFLQAQIDKENGEIERFNQTVTMYNAAYANFQNWYNRTRAPRGTAVRCRF